MAEFVELRKERMLPEYEQMRALKLCNDDDITKIKKSREAFEYRIAQPTREIKDYLEYIKYERSLVTLTKERIKTHKITTHNSIIKLISIRMKQLYAQALAKFPNDTRFWDEYIKFLQHFKFNTDISATFDRMLQFHGDKPNVWIRAILWEYNENYQDHRVKGLLLRAQQRHPESQMLYFTWFQIELENKRRSTQASALQHAQVVYTNFKKKFFETEYFINMLNIADKFNYAKSMQQQILNDMRKLFPRRELLWHTLAQRELHGLSGSDGTSALLEKVKNDLVLAAESAASELEERSTKSPDNPALKAAISFTSDTPENTLSTSAGTSSMAAASTVVLSTSKALPSSSTSADTSATSSPTPSISSAIAVSSPTSTAAAQSDPNGDINLLKEPIPTAEFLIQHQQNVQKKRVEMCVQVYDAAVKVLNTTQMWDYYINAMLALNSDLTAHAVLKRSVLSRAFKAGNASSKMSEALYLKYVELLFSNDRNDETIPFVLNKASQIHYSSLKVWMQSMRFYIQMNDFPRVLDVFQKAKKKLGPNGYELWHLFMIFSKTSQEKEAKIEFDKLVQDAAFQQHATFNSFKAKVLELLATTVGIKRARKAYYMFVKHYPKSLEVHEMMADLESKQMKRDVKAERHCLEMLIANFGRQRTDVWLRYMKFERSFGEPKNVSKIYEKAMQRLNTELIDDFLSLHNLFINGVV